MDKMVLEVQKWLNKTYKGKSGYETIPENGKTGNTTVGALIIGLQIELGIPNPVPTFGPATTKKFPGLARQKSGAKPNNLIKILQGGFWCKGLTTQVVFQVISLETRRIKLKILKRMLGLNQLGLLMQNL